MALRHKYLQGLCHTHDYEAQFAEVWGGTIEEYWYFNNPTLQFRASTAFLTSTRTPRTSTTLRTSMLPHSFYLTSDVIWHQELLMMADGYEWVEVFLFPLLRETRMTSMMMMPLGG
ncbi:unnamed protein product [Linum trigynum]|uniref:Uncharacterized protein n=1 Tax=Linum trigynum TaxID=586398 RepID=A0AAV2GMC9_9ROSI